MWVYKTNEIWREFMRILREISCNVLCENMAAYSLSYIVLMQNTVSKSIWIPRLLIAFII